MMRRVLGEGRYLRLVEADGWEWAERTNASGVVIVLAITEADEVLLVEQHRRPVDARVIELPAGLAGDVSGQEQEALGDAAARELEEETGYRAGVLAPLTHGPISAGLTNEMVAFYRARDLVKIGSGGGDSTEEITVHAVPVASVAAWLAEQQARGRLIDPKVYTGLWFMGLEPRDAP